MIKHKCIACIKENPLYGEIFAKDFATKLVHVYKAYKYSLVNDISTNLLIYNYFYGMFPELEVVFWNADSVEDIGILDDNIVKEVCNEIFEQHGESFIQDYLGGGEFPFIKVWKVGKQHCYNITR